MACTGVKTSRITATTNLSEHAADRKDSRPRPRKRPGVYTKRCPNPTGEESELEIRQIFEAEDFGEEFTPELREQEERLRAEIAGKS